MFCSRCSKQIPDDSRFCEFCGAAIETKEAFNSNETPIKSADNQKKKKQRLFPDPEYFNSVLSLSSRPTKWLNFYVKVLFPLNAIFNVMLSLGIIIFIFMVKGFYNEFTSLYIVIPLLAFYTYTFFELYRMSRTGFILNIISLLLNTFILKFCYVTYLFAALYALYVIPNVIYFITRRSLFFDIELHNVAAIRLNDNQTAEKIRKHKDEYFDNICNSSPLSTKWLQFYVNVSFPLGILAGVVAYIIALVYFITNLYSYSDFHIALVVTLSAALLAFYAYTYSQMRKMSPQGYISNIFILVFESFTFALSYDGAPYDTLPYDMIEIYAVKTIAYCLLFLIPNLIYFKKRKNLFYDEELHKAALEKIS